MLIKYSGDLKSDHLKSGNIWNPDFLKVGFQMVRFSNGRALAINHSKSGRFCPDFKWFLTKWRPFVRISNGWASGFQIPFEIQTICNPTCFGPFEIQTRSDFRSPLYLNTRLVRFSNDRFLSSCQIVRYSEENRTEKGCEVQNVCFQIIHQITWLYHLNTRHP